MPDHATPGTTDDRRATALRGGLWSAASQVLPAAGTLALSVAAGRYLGSGPLGEQSLIAYVNSAAASIVYLSLNTALLQLAGRLQGQGDRLRFAALTRWAIGAHLGAGAVVLLIMTALSRGLTNEHTAWIVLGTVSVLDAAADGLAIRLVIVEGWAPTGRLRLVFQFVGPPLGLAFMFAGLGITGIFLGDGIAAAGLLVTVVRRFVRLRQGGQRSFEGSHSTSAGMPPVPEDPAATTVWSAGTSVRDEHDDLFTAPNPLRPPVAVARTWGLFALGALITQIVAKRVEFVVLAMFTDDSTIAMYSVAFMAVNLIAIVPLGVAAAAMPVVAAAEARGETDRAAYHLRMALRLGTVISVPIVAFLCVFGPEAINLVYGSRYTEAARLVPLASVSLLVAVVTGVCTQFWSGLGRLGIVIGTGVAAAVADLAMAFALVPRFGASGAVWANLAGQVVLAGSLIYATTRQSGPIGWRWAGLLESVIAAGCAAIVAAATKIVLDHLYPSTGAELRSAAGLLIGLLLGIPVFAFVAVRIKLIDDREADWLAAVTPRRLHPVLARVTEPSTSTMR